MSGPPESVLAWMAAELGAGLASVERPLRDGGSPWLIRLDSADGGVGGREGVAGGR
jgi:hypothetical protein